GIFGGDRGGEEALAGESVRAGLVGDAARNGAQHDRKRPFHGELQVFQLKDDDARRGASRGGRPPAASLDQASGGGGPRGSGKRVARSAGCTVGRGPVATSRGAGTTSATGAGGEGRMNIAAMQNAQCAHGEPGAAGSAEE